MFSGTMLILLPVILGITLVSVPVEAYNKALLVETDRHVYLLGEEVTIILTNIGNKTLGFGGWPPCDVYRIYPDWEFCYPTCYAWLAWSLEPGESVNDTWDQYNGFTQRYVKPGVYMAYEYNYNHTVYFTITFREDLNYDGKVDMQDLYIVIQAFGSYPGHPQWNPIADINEDNTVDTRDIYLIITNFGKAC